MERTTRTLRTKELAQKRLLSRRIVALPILKTKLAQLVGLERRRWSELDLNLAVFSIASVVFGPVAQNLLVPQLQADFHGDIRQVGQILHGEIPAAGRFAQLAEESGACDFFGGASAAPDWFEDSDRINL